MASPRNLRDMNLFVEGRGHVGLVTELTLPKLTRKTEEHRAGGMQAPVEIDMGMEKLEADFTLIDFNEAILKLWGLTNAAGVSLRFKGSIARDDGSGREDPVEIALRGRWREVDMGSWKPGDSAPLKVAVAATYYQYLQANQTLIEIDVLNAVEKVGGVDRLAQRRANLGM